MGLRKIEGLPSAGRFSKHLRASYPGNIEFFVLPSVKGISSKQYQVVFIEGGLGRVIGVYTTEKRQINGDGEFEVLRTYRGVLPDYAPKQYALWEVGGNIELIYRSRTFKDSRIKGRKFVEGKRTEGVRGDRHAIPFP